jgi:hypothetical protein
MLPVSEMGFTPFSRRAPQRHLPGEATVGGVVLSLLRGGLYRFRKRRIFVQDRVIAGSLST